MAEADTVIPRILIVDDDREVRVTLMNYFEDQNMVVTSAGDRTEMTRHLAGNASNLMLLDLRLGEDNGLDILREIRARSDMPVIIMTGDRRDEIDRVVGLELGADDYITKPFGLRELLARIRAVLRRHGRAQSLAVRNTDDGGYRFDGWLLDRRSRRLANPAGLPVLLTKGEYALLVAFLDAPGRPLTREHLLQATRMHEDVDDRSIDVQVLRLRRKLEADPGTQRAIMTARGIGYAFAVPVQHV